MSRTKKIAFGCVLGVPLLCCVGGLIFVWGATSRSDRFLKEELAAARSVGLPTELKELPLIPVDRASNAAPLYQRAITVANRDEMKKALSAIGAAITRDPKPEAERLAAVEAPKLRSLYPLLEAATELPQCQFDRQWSLGFNVLFPEYASMKGFVKLLAFRADRASERGDWRSALEDIRRCFRISEHAGSDPVLIAALVQIACDAIAQTQFRRIIDRHGRDATFLRAAQQLASERRPLPDFRRIMAGELVLSRISLRELRSLREIEALLPDGEMPRAPSGLERTVFNSKLVRNTFDGKLVNAYRTMYPELPSDPEDWPKTYDAMIKMERAVEADRTLAGTMNRILLPVFNQAADAAGRMQANRRLTVTALHLLLMRARTGRLPERLPNLGEATQDPFADGPLQYGRKGSGFLLYSVGQDREDNGGQVRRTEGSYDDVVEFS